MHRSPRVHLPFWKSKHGFPLKVDGTGREAEAEAEEEEDDEEEEEVEVVEVGAASSSELPSLPYPARRSIVTCLCCPRCSRPFG